MGASLHRPTPLNLIIRKEGWVIPGGTSVRVRATFSDGTSMDFQGKGHGNVVQIGLEGKEADAWVQALASNVTVQLAFAGTEAPWNFDLAGAAEAVGNMSSCLRAHGVNGVPGSFSTFEQPNSDTNSSSTQPFGGNLPPLAKAPAEPEPARPPSTGMTVPQAGPVAQANPSSTSCRDDWRRCSDNADVVNNYGKYIQVQEECKDKVNEGVKYGTPVWPGFWSGGAFGTFHKGKDYVLTGIVVAIEPNVQIQNVYGSMPHYTAYCRYDLKTMSVVSVDTVEH